jgi:hypothetical protein
MKRMEKEHERKWEKDMKVRKEKGKEENRRECRNDREYLPLNFKGLLL